MFSTATFVILFVLLMTFVLHVIVRMSMEYRDYLVHNDPFFKKAWRRMMWPVVIVYEFIKYSVLFQFIVFLALCAYHVIDAKKAQEMLWLSHNKYPLKFFTDAYNMMQNPYAVVPLAIGIVIMTALYWKSGFKNWKTCVQFAPEKEVRVLLVATGMVSLLYIGSYVLYVIIWHDLVFINGLFIPIWNELWDIAPPRPVSNAAG